MATIAVELSQLMGGLRDIKMPRSRVLDPAFLAIFDIVPAYIFIALDPECRKIIGNRATCRLLKVPPGSNISKTAPPGQAPGCYDGANRCPVDPADLPMQRAARGEVLSGSICELPLADGEVVWLEGSAYPLRDQAGQIWGALGAFIDVSASKRTERSLQRALAEADAARADAEATHRSKSNLVATLSHDLRQPVQALLMYHHALESMVSEVGRDLLAKAQRCATTLAELVGDTLDVAKLDAGVMPVNVKPVEIGAVVDRALNAVQPLAEAKGLEVRRVHCSSFVRTDAALLERILTNLLSNAVKYTEAGRVLIGCRRFGARLRVGVLDTGPGIPADSLAKVFEDYYRVEGTGQPGTGLGLAIVDRIARRLALPVTVRSQVGSGSAFTVEIPIANPQTRPGR